MQLKTYHSDSMQKAMKLIRKELGSDAVIVSSQETPNGVVVVAAQDNDINTQPHTRHLVDEVIACLEQHNIREDLVQQLVSYTPYATATTKVEALTQIILPNYSFQPLLYPKAGDQWMLVGPPGVGKTATIAKLAAHCMVKNIPVIIVTLDKDKAGAIEQIKTLGQSVQANVVASTEPSILKKVLAKCPKNYVILIDTPGTNPYDFNALSRLYKYVEVSQLKPILILNGIGNDQDLLDQSKAFAVVNADRLILTQMDLVRRLGSLFTLMNDGSLALCAYSSGPYIADLITPLTAYSLADFMVKKQNEFFASNLTYPVKRQGSL